MENQEEFVLAYAALCKKHGLCIVAEAWNGTLCVWDLDDAESWVAELVVREGREVFEAYEAQEV